MSVPVLRIPALHDAGITGARRGRFMPRSVPQAAKGQWAFCRFANILRARKCSGGNC